jgi:hypothetical protein
MELQVLQSVQVDSVQALHWEQVDSVRSVVNHHQNALRRRQDGHAQLVDSTFQRQ